MVKDRPIESYIWQLTKAALSIIAVILYSRYLGAAGRGSMSIYLLYVQVFLMLNEMFVGSALANWISLYGLRRFIPRIFVVTTIMLGLALGLGYAFDLVKSPNFEPSNHNDRTSILLLLLFGIWAAILICQNIASNFFQSTGAIIEKNKWMVGFELLKVSGLLALIFGLAGSEISLERIMLSLVITGAIWVLFCIYRLHMLKAWSPLQTDNGNITIAHTWTEGVWAQLGQIVLFLIYRTPLFMASYLMGDAAAGILANALLVIDTIWIFSNTMGTIVHGRALVNLSKVEQEDLCLRFSVFSFWGTLGLCLGVLIIPADVFTWIFGMEFYPMKNIVIQSIPGILALAYFAPYGNLFHARNQFKRLLVHHLFGLLVMVILLTGIYFQIESVDFTHLIWTWNISLSGVLLMHILRRNFLNLTSLKFKVNTLLLYRLVIKFLRY